MNKDSLVTEIYKKNKGLKKSEIEGLLYVLMNNPKGLTTAVFATLTGVPKETLLAFKASISAYLNENYEGFQLKDEFIQTLTDFDWKPFDWSLLELEDLKLEEDLRNLRDSTKFEPKRELDQFIATSKTSVAKALLAQKKGLLDNAQIAFVGDDDFVSLAVERLLGDDSSITVFDIDPVLLEEIRSMSTKGIQTIQHDCRVRIPSLYQNNYSLVITDPPYTVNGVKIFLNRAIELLGKADVNDNKYILLFYGNSFKSPEKTLKIQEILEDMKLLIEDKVDKFARYHGAESIGNASSAYVLKVTPFTHSIDVADDSGVYTYENQKTEKFPYVDHFTFKLMGVEEKFLRSPANLTKVLARFCDMHHLKVVDKVTTEFKGGGLTITLVLSASNMTVHTWPEYRALHIDLITCSPVYNKDNFRLTIQKVFSPLTAEIRKIE